MAEALTVDLDVDGLRPRLQALHTQITSGEISALTLDLSDARNFGAFDLQALIHLERAASEANIPVTTVGASGPQSLVLGSRSSSTADISEPS